MRVKEAGYNVELMPAPTVIHCDYEKSLGHFAYKEYHRQLYTLRLARIHGFSLRSLRNPILSAFHLTCIGATLFVFLTRDFPVLLPLVAVWLLPSALFCFKRRGAQAGRFDRLRLLFLYWTRWNAAALALLAQGIRIVRLLLKRGGSI